MRDWLRILSIDGGGIRGLISVLILAEIERRTGHPVRRLFDLIAGCSSGSIIALGLAQPEARDTPMSQTAQLTHLFEEDGPAIFSKSLLRRVRTLGGLTKPRYPHRPLEQVLKRYYGGTTLGDITTDVLIPSYAMETRQLLLLSNCDERYRPLHLYDVALAGSSAEVLFSPVQVTIEGQPLALIDAGIFAGNTAMLAYAFCAASHERAANVLLVSIGVGRTTEPFHYADARKWGAIQWVWPLLEIMRDGHIELVDIQVNRLFSSLQAQGAHHYFRCDHPLGSASSSLDNASPENIAALRDVAEAYIREQSGYLDTLCGILLEAKP